jgi:hypothetical protein
MGQIPYSIWEVAIGHFKSAEQELHSARVELDRLKPLQGKRVSIEYGAALRAWCSAAVVYGEALSKYNATLGSVESL